MKNLLKLELRRALMYNKVDALDEDIDEISTEDVVSVLIQFVLEQDEEIQKLKNNPRGSLS